MCNWCHRRQSYTYETRDLGPEIILIEIHFLWSFFMQCVIKNCINEMLTVIDQGLLELLKSPRKFRERFPNNTHPPFGGLCLWSRNVDDDSLFGPWESITIKTSIIIIISTTVNMKIIEFTLRTIKRTILPFDICGHSGH